MQVTSVDSTAVSGCKDIGSNCNVTTKDKTPEWNIAAKGNNNIYGIYIQEFN